VSATIHIDGVDQVASDTREIEEARGFPVSLDELAGLMAHGRTIEEAYRGCSEAVSRDGLLPRCVRVGNARLHSLTIAGRLMLRRLLIWNAEDEALFDQETWDVLQAWVFAHCRDRDALAGLCTPEDAAAIALAWSAELTCSSAELAEAIEILTDGAAPPVRPGADDGEADGAGGADEADIARALAKHSGGTPDHWLFDVSEAQAGHIMDAINQAALADSAAAARAAGKLPPPDADMRLKAVARFEEYLAKLKAVKRG